MKRSFRFVALLVFLSNCIAEAQQTFTFTSSAGFQSTLGRALPYPSIIPVMGIGPVSDVRVTLNIVDAHFYGLAYVESPSGQQCLLLRYQSTFALRGSGTLTFADSATAFVTTNPAATFSTGTYRPTDHGRAFGPTPPMVTNLSTFNGIDPTGDWKLYWDNGSGLGSRISSWSLTFESVPKPPARGDLDGDGGATALDLARLLNHIQAAGSPGHTNQLPAELRTAADLNQDGAIDQADIGLLRDAVLELRSVPSAPIAVSANTSFQTSFRLAAGEYHTLMVREDGTLWAWGNNSYGQVGDGTSGLDQSRFLPVPIASNFIWKAIAAGSSHSLALRADGTLWSWGYGYRGDGAVTSRLSPAPVATNFIWKAIATGREHSLAVREDGTLWAWGWNDYGQVGDGTRTERLSPVPIATNFSWKAIAAGRQHSLAIRENGTLWSWGINQNGQVGDGTRTDRYLPMPIATNIVWKAIAAGSAHSLALSEDGMLWAWGANYRGALGDRTSMDRLSPVPIATNFIWKAIAAGNAHSLGIREDGRLWAWGNNQNGQLGDGTRTERLSPVPIAANFIWKAIGAGWAHSLALREDGTLWGWGWNPYGQVGDGTSTRCYESGCYDRLLPVPVVINALSPKPATARRLYLGGVRGFPNRIVEIPIQFRNPTNQPPVIVALQADIEFESTAVSLGGPAEGDALPDHRVVSSELMPGVRRVLIYSTNNTLFPNGVLATLPFSIGPKVFHNPRIVLTNVILVTASATSAPFTGRLGGIAIVPVVVGSDGVAEGFITVPPDPVNERCFVVQSSSDLRSWANIVTNSVIGNVLQFVDPTVQPPSPRFYRAVACP